MTEKTDHLQHTWNISRAVTNFMLVFFVIYYVLQCTAISFRLSNLFIIAAFFVVLCIHIFITLKYKNIQFSLRNRHDPKSLGHYIGKLDLVLFVFLLINSIWLLIIPKMNGGSISQAVSEAGMLLVFVLYFPLAVLIRIKEIQFETILKVFFRTIVVLAVIHIGLWIYETGHKNGVQEILNYIGVHFGKIFRTADLISGWGIVRIVFSNSLLLGIGLLLLFLKAGSFKPLDYILGAVLTFGVICPGLRSLWGGTAAGFGIMAIYFVFAVCKGRKKVWRQMLAFVIVVAATVLLLNGTLFHGTILNRLMNTFNGNAVTSSDLSASPKSAFDEEIDTIGTAVSNTYKKEESEKLIHAWLQKPVLGSGYGGSIEGYPGKSAPYAYEMTSLSLLFKMGIIGFAVWALLVVSIMIHAIRNWKKKPWKLAVWFATFTCFFLTIQTNPLLFTANALSFIMYLALATVGAEQPEQERLERSK